MSAKTNYNNINLGKWKTLQTNIAMNNVYENKVF